MKIVHIIIGLEVGGAELMLKRLVLHSSRKGQFQHIVVSLTELGNIGIELQKEGIEVYSLGLKSSFSIARTLVKLRVLLKHLQPDVVQTWMYHADFLGGLAAKSLGIKNIIWGIRTTDVSQGASQLTVYLSKICAKLSYYIPNTIVCAAHVSKKHHIEIGYDETKMIVIPNGFDLEAISASDEDGLEIRHQNNLSAEDIVIGSVGRFNPVKNQKLFVDVAAELLKEYPNLKFMMVGRDNTEENKELMTWLKNYDIVDSFRLLGQRSDVPKCLKAMSIFCLHSKTEGFPNVLCEAMYAGLPCISTDVGDSNYIMQNLGFCSKKDDIQKLAHEAHNIINIVLNDHEKLIILRERSRKHIANNFSIASVSQEYSKIWQF